MKVLVLCSSCSFKSHGEKEILGYRVPVTESGLCSFTCYQNHQKTYIIRDHKFALLFDLGANAIIDGYYREAVSSFTSSMERFFEFYIDVIRRVDNISDQIFDAIWISISKQSERQLGAYTILYGLRNAKLPPLPPPNKKIIGKGNDKTNMTNFRNKVTHNGYIPTREEAVQFGEAVLEIINPVYKDLKKGDESEKIMKSMMDERRDRLLKEIGGYGSEGIYYEGYSYENISILNPHSNSKFSSLSEWLENNRRQGPEVEQVVAEPADPAAFQNI